ncbi:ARF guanine-nucleotide exchange factor GNOM [Vitis vinifera]|uniref:ARF guanine-nucleotide exchange factor GNOM n=1 Tax=Vitis vinifera TaxID=29760 RepID=A0A438EQ85_VITVI|nr:ARF guanine-nucleotide exchange factor GNOM [Vitis vinifera]
MPQGSFLSLVLVRPERSVRALDLMAGSVVCLSHWALEAKQAMAEEELSKMSQDIGEMWLSLWLQCFDMVIFTMLDDLLDIAQGHSQKDYRNMEGTLSLAMKLLSKVKVKGKRSEKLPELVPELLKNTLLVMKTRGVLVQRSALGGDSLWELTWLHVNNIAPTLQSEVFPDQGLDQPRDKKDETGRSLVSDEMGSVPSNETVVSEGEIDEDSLNLVLIGAASCEFAPEEGSLLLVQYLDSLVHRVIEIKARFLLIMF